jgi:predicted permease
MRMLRTLRLRVRSLFRETGVERDLDDELRDHLDRQIDAFRAGGLSHADARAAALREFGNVALVRDQCRDTRRVNWIADARRDFGYALRTLRRAPGYATVAIVSLGLAIGANTAIFSIVNVLMLRDLDVANPHQLVEVGRQSPFGRGNFSYPLYERVRDQNTVFAGILTLSSGTIQATIAEAARQPIGRYVSGSFFDVLGITPAAGRLFSAEIDRAIGGEGSTVAVISHGLWQRDYGTDPGVIGKTLRIDAVPFTIVGVLPPTFHGLVVGRPDDFYIPMASEPRLRRPSWLANGHFGWLTVVGRLEPGTTHAEAHANLNVISGRYLDDFVTALDNQNEVRELRAQRLVVEPARAGLSAPRREFSRPVLLLMGAVALVLLIACANVVNLLLARGIARRREIGLRLAIGASGSRIVRQLLSEAVVTGLIGGAAGLALAIWGTRVLAAYMADGDPRVSFDFAPDGQVLRFTALISIGSALLAGIAPALRARRTSLTPGMRDDGPIVSVTRTGTLWTRGLIALQVALSLLLLTGASLLITSLRNLHAADPGFDRDRVLLTGLSPGRAGINADRRLAYYRQVLDRARQTAGVSAAGLSMITPISGTSVDFSFTVAGRPRDPGPNVYVNLISDGYFGTMGMRLLGGRDFRTADTADSQGVVIINDALSRRYFGAANPIGQRVKVGGYEGLEIVGVVANAKYVSLREEDRPTVYLNALQRRDVGGLTLTVSTISDPGSAAATVRREVQAIAATVPVGQAVPLSAQIDRSLARERLMTRILIWFAALAVLLAAVGLYGVLGYFVTRRTHEIGIRLALGATRGTVLWAVIRESWMLVGIGIAIGLPAAIGATRLLSTFLFGVTPTDPWVLGGVCAGLFVVAVIAASQPAWRAVRVDPLTALRYE